MGYTINSQMYNKKTPWNYKGVFLYIILFQKRCLDIYNNQR